MKLFNQLVLSAMLLLLFVSCSQRFEDTTLIISPAEKDCENANLVWRVDTVRNGKVLQPGNLIYLINSNLVAENDKLMKVTGITDGTLMNQRFEGCGDVFELRDIKVEELDAPK